MKVLVVGLGLIGGSIAKSLKKHSDSFILGCDNDSATLQDALKCKVIDFVWSEGEPCSADLTVLCMTPSAVVDFLKKNAKFLKDDSVVTDVCGIKEWVVEKCDVICSDNNLHFIGGHPMAGKERSGFKNSDENLFNRASYILTPVDTTSKKAIDTAKEFIANLNAARITVTTPQNHDRMIAFTSQMPHIIAGSYVKSPSCATRKGFSAGSFNDVSRVATVDENLWAELFMKNKEMLLPELVSMIYEMNTYKTALENNDIESLKASIRMGRIIKENDLRDFEREDKGSKNA